MDLVLAWIFGNVIVLESKVVGDMGTSFLSLCSGTFFFGAKLCSGT